LWRKEKDTTWTPWLV